MSLGCFLSTSLKKHFMKSPKSQTWQVHEKQCFALICIVRYWMSILQRDSPPSCMCPCGVQIWMRTKQRNKWLRVESSGDLDDFHAAGEAGLAAPLGHLLSGSAVRHAVHLAAPVLQLLLEAALLVPAPAWVSSVSAALPATSPHRLQTRSAAVEACRLGGEEPAPGYGSEDDVWVPAF